MRHLALLASGAVWAGMMALLFHREILPYFEFQQPPSYKVQFRDQAEPESERRAVYFTEGRTRIGEAETVVEPRAGGGAALRTRFLLNMAAFSAIPLPDTRVYIASETQVGSDWQLTEFRMDGIVAGIPISVRGTRSGGQMLLSYTFLKARGEKLVDLPPDAVLSDSFTPYVGGGRLEEGKKWRMRMIDLGSLLGAGRGGQLGFTEKYATVVGREVVMVGGRDVPAWKVSVQEQPNDEPEKWAYQIWVDESGTVVQHLMKINGLPCLVVLERKRALTAEEAGAYRWSVEAPR